MAGKDFGSELVLEKTDGVVDLLSSGGGGAGG